VRMFDARVRVKARFIYDKRNRMKLFSFRFLGKNK